MVAQNWTGVRLNCSIAASCPSPADWTTPSPADGSWCPDTNQTTANNPFICRTRTHYLNIDSGRSINDAKRKNTRRNILLSIENILDNNLIFSYLILNLINFVHSFVHTVTTYACLNYCSELRLVCTGSIRAEPSGSNWPGPESRERIRCLRPDTTARSSDSSQRPDTPPYRSPSSPGSDPDAARCILLRCAACIATSSRVCSIT